MEQEAIEIEPEEIKTEPTVTYHLASVFDIPMITVMWRDMVAEELFGFIAVDEDELRRYAFTMTDYIRQWNQVVIVAKIEGRIIGYTHAYVYQNKYGKPVTMAFSESSYVKPDYRDKGIGMELVENCRAVIAKRELKVDCEEFTVPYDQEHIDSWAKRGWYPTRVIMRKRG